MKATPSQRLPRLFAGRRRRALAQLGAVAVARAACMGASVLLVRAVFDGLGHADSTIRALAALTACVGADALCQAYERASAERLGHDYVNQVRSRLFAHVARLDLRRSGARGRGALMLRMFGDLTPLRQWIGLGVVRIAVASIVTTAALLALAWMDLALAGAVTVVAAVGVSASWLAGRRLRRASSALRASRGKLANFVSERTAAVGVLRAFGTERSERRALERRQAQLHAETLARARALGLLRAIASATTGVASVTALAVGVERVQTGHATSGAVAATLALVGLLAPTFRDLGRVHESWVESRVTLAKLLELFALPALASGAARLPSSARRGPLAVEFEAVAVEGALRPFDAQIRAGLRVAITGPAGSGKSTLIGLLARTVRPDRGRVRLAGVELGSLARRDFRRRVGIASSELPLLRASLERNLRYRWRSADGASLARALERCELGPFIAGLPERAATRLSEGGANLSVSERRRVMLARAVLGEPGLLLLDGMDTGLDAPARACLSRLIASYPGTVVFSSHDEDFLRLADEVWRLDAGRLHRTTNTLTHPQSP